MVEIRKVEKIIEKTTYEEIGDFSFVVRCECGKWIRIKIPVLICRPKKVSADESNT